MKHEALLNLFEEKPGEFISGEEISRQLLISRSAVWKQINKLRELGYEFEAISRVGYRISGTPDLLNAMEIQMALKTRRFGRKVKIIETTSSTQEDAARLAEEGAAEGTLVIANEQTAGRGRQGRKFYSPRGKGIWMTLLLRPEKPLPYTPQLTLLSGVAVCRAIRQLTGVEAGIKWPNDLLVNGRKICGILLESAAEDELVRYCLAGIGIDANVEPEDYPEELRSIATSLKAEAGNKINRNQLIAAIMNEFEMLYDLYCTEGFQPIAALWEALSVSLGREVRTKSRLGPVTGIARGLDESGALIVEQSSGERLVVFSGEIELGT
ncbi:biotin--[acetyl-CoA-carboxylase] ligase [Paenibacillus sp. JX-17]|uniref:Bifunctional ligase/repressor BirA n=1 Tax=Paenibacillus lacisoli TaxID=3064525 RepID=A0ABT9C812_9BACL|nr:biotin--[acetyl-CoA-carboxylase] ligase [Paenibacillus sp. JX-17]MDO7905035.1 biotin--[acetyl-CoA-carboxylase] ligase [Paenibacillus sp. JX-17]